MKSPSPTPRHVLFIETYPAGSHGRVLDLLKIHSQHAIWDIRLDRAHWKWLAIAAHYDVASALTQSPLRQLPDVLIFSGPLNVTGLVSLLPAELQVVPRITYFHESQWTYPSLEADPRPYVLQHLDAISVSKEAWFNSRYHVETFWDVATSSDSDLRVRKLARTLRPTLEPRCRVVYPPVARTLRSSGPRKGSDRPRLLWNARWEMDKRPDLFIELLDRLLLKGVTHETLILGTGTVSRDVILEQLGDHAQRAIVPGHLDSREEYDDLVASADVFISTAEHEFFGIAALEAALAGVIPLVPNALAYPETLPSAFSYEPGDVNELSAVAARLLTQRPATHSAHESDASRFIPQRMVPLWDEHIERVAAAGET